MSESDLSWVSWSVSPISKLLSDVDRPCPRAFTYASFLVQPRKKASLCTSNSNELGSVTGRLGYSFGPALLYAKGGYAFKDGDHVLVAGSPFGVATTGNTRDGYTVGAGLEYMFAPNWSAKIEYQYYNFGSTTFLSPVALAGARFNDDEHTVKAGVNYRFNWGGPVVARY